MQERVGQPAPGRARRARDDLDSGARLAASRRLVVEVPEHDQCLAGGQVLLDAGPDPGGLGALQGAVLLGLPGLLTVPSLGLRL